LGCTTDRVVLIQTTYVAAADVRKQARAIFPHKFNRFGKLICPSGWLSEFSSSPGIKNISLFQNPKSPVCPRHPAPFRRDVSRSSRHVGAGCDGRGGIEKTNDTCRVRQSHAVLSPRCWRQAGDNASHCAGDGDNKAGLRGEHGISRQPVARGKPGDPAVPVVTNSYAFYFCIRGCGRNGHPAFPAPSL
jgi:hypothetical protein